MPALLDDSVVIAGAWWWAKNRELADWQQKIRVAQVELDRLVEIRKKGEYYKAQKERLERQIQLVTDLKKQQDVPVHILDQISKKLPEFLWLEGMSVNNNQVSLNGKATTYNAVTNFYNNVVNDTIRFQVMLSEATGQIIVCYPDMDSAMAPGTSGAEATAGVQEDSMNALEFSCNTGDLTTGRQLLYIPL